MLAAQQMPNKFWRGGRAAEGARLESVYTVKRIEGSNPSLSANLVLNRYANRLHRIFVIFLPLKASRPLVNLRMRKRRYSAVLLPETHGPYRSGLGAEPRIPGRALIRSTSSASLTAQPILIFTGN